MPILYITKVQLPGREKYLSAATEDLVEVSWGDPISRRSYKKPEVGRVLSQVAEEGFKKGLEVTFTVPKSVSTAAEVLGDLRVRSAVIREARGLGHRLFEVCPLRQRGLGDIRPKPRFIVFAHRATNPKKGEPQPHLHLHMVLFAAHVGRQNHDLNELDLRPMFERRKMFHARFLCGLAQRLRCLGYTIVPTKEGFELKESGEFMARQTTH